MSAIGEGAVLCRLSGVDRAFYFDHLRGLATPDRWNRFAGATNDGTINRYVAGIAFAREPVFAIIGADRRVLGAMHLGLERDAADIGISVLLEARRNGMGTRLVRRGISWCRNRGIRAMVSLCAPDNIGMARVALKVGMLMEHDSGERMARLSVDPPTPVSALGEALLMQREEWIRATRFAERVIVRKAASYSVIT